MDVIISPEIFIHYFLNKLTPHKTEIEKNVDFIIDNELNNIVLSSRLIDIIDSKIDAVSPLKQYFHTYLGEIINKRTFSPIIPEEYKELEIFEQLCNSYKESTINNRRDFCFSFRKKCEKSTKVTDCIMEDYKKPNFHWLGYNLAAFSPRSTTLRYFDFTSDKEINSLIAFYISCCNSFSTISIFDRNLNIDHSFFSSFNGKAPIHYYTLDNGTLKNDTNIKELRNKMKQLKMFVADRKQIHERRILIRNLVIEFDDDFWNIEVNKSTWKIDFTYCPITAQRLTDKTRQFRNIIAR